MADQQTIFISYSRADSTFVDRLDADLRARGYNTWVDRSRLVGGVEWWEEIKKAIATCSLFLIALSPSAVGREWVQKEYEEGQQLGKRLMPVIIENITTPTWLSAIDRIQKVDFSNLNAYALKFKELLYAILNPTLNPSASTKDIYSRALALRTTDPELAAILLQQIIDHEPNYSFGQPQRDLANLDTQLYASRVARLRTQAQQARREGQYRVEAASLEALIALGNRDASAYAWAREYLPVAQQNSAGCDLYDIIQERIEANDLSTAHDTLLQLWQKAPFFRDPADLAPRLGIVAPPSYEQVQAARAKAEAIAAAAQVKAAASAAQTAVSAAAQANASGNALAGANAAATARKEAARAEDARIEAGKAAGRAAKAAAEAAATAKPQAAADAKADAEAAAQAAITAKADAEAAAQAVIQARNEAIESKRKAAVIESERDRKDAAIEDERNLFEQACAVILKNRSSQSLSKVRANLAALTYDFDNSAAISLVEKQMSCWRRAERRDMLGFFMTIGINRFVFATVAVIAYLVLYYCFATWAYAPTANYFAKLGETIDPILANLIFLVVGLLVLAGFPYGTWGVWKAVGWIGELAQEVGESLATTWIDHARAEADAAYQQWRALAEQVLQQRIDAINRS